MNATYVIVGASIAGVTAAEAIRAAGEDRVVLIDPDPQAPFDKTALSKDVLVAPTLPEFGLRPSGHLERLGIERLTAAAIGLDATGKVVLLDDGSTVSYDRLLVATGARAVTRFRVDGDERILSLRSAQDATRLRAALSNADHVAVIGAGLIGCEVASAARYLGVRTTIVDFDRGPFMRAFGPDVSAAISAIQQEAGVDQVFGSAVESVVEVPGGKVVVRHGDGASIEADVVVLGTGVIPDVDWLKESGIELANGIVCDERLAASLPDVFAAGDVANTPGGPDGRRVRLEHWANAAEQGAAAARSMMSTQVEGEPWVPPTPHFMTVLHGHRITSLGHPGGGPGVESSVLATTDPGTHRMSALYEEGGRLVGCLTIDQPRLAARLGGLIGKPDSWSTAIGLVRETQAA